jgi:hypothetical protein
VLLAVLAGVLVFPNFDGAVSGFGAGVVGFRQYIDHDFTSSTNNLYPGTKCKIYSNAMLVSDVLPSVFDSWAETYARSFNMMMDRFFSGAISTQCGTLVDPDSITFSDVDS